MPGFLLKGSIFLLLAAAAVNSAQAAGVRLRWKRVPIIISVSNSLLRENSNIAADADTKGAIERSLSSWQRAANITFKEISSSEQNVSPAGNKGDGISLITIAQTPENLALFPDGPSDASARTRVFYDRYDSITEADIVLNPYLQFSTNGTIGTYDLESTITHEVGHLLGLPHSLVLGATMHENIGKNGIFNIPLLNSRTLSDDDVSAIRELYGQPSAATNCCGKAAGRLTDTSGKAVAGIRVWAEEKTTSRVIAETVTTDTGNFRFNALAQADYRFWAQDAGDGNNRYAAEKIGEFTLEKYGSVVLNKKLNRRPVSFEARYIGFNGQLAELAVPLNAGGEYTVYIGGSNLDPNKIRVKTDSQSILIREDVSSTEDFGDRVSVISFRVFVNYEAGPGDYSLYIEDNEGLRSYLVGCISVEKFPNPWGFLSFNSRLSDQ